MRGTSGNSINGISPKNPRHDEYMEAYETLLINGIITDIVEM